MRAVLVVGMLAGVAGAAPLPAEWALSKADGEKWVARVRKLTRDGWTVSLNGNEITIRRDKPVAVALVVPNMAPGQKPLPDGEATVRFVLRFAPRMPADEYDRLAAENAKSADEYGRLHRAVGLPHKFDDFIAKTDEEEERVRAFREAVAKLPRHDLPVLYAPDHSIFVVTADAGFSCRFPADEAVCAEVLDVGHTLERYFGMYDPRMRRCEADYVRHDPRR
jgi:hypothetical protein